VRDLDITGSSSGNVDWNVRNVGNTSSDGLTLIVSGTVVADVLDAGGETLDELFVENADGLGTVVVPVDTDDTVVLSARLAVFEELLSGRSGQFLL
jgi:hypothetical protein